jgi:prephenate dehydrogenase
MNVGGAGLGLMGGSAAKALQERTDHRVWGFDKNPDVMKMALECGAIDAPLSEERLGHCDIVLVALYPRDTVDYVASQAPRLQKGAAVVDFCGVKRPVCAALSPLAAAFGFTFVGGPPKAGVARSGFMSSNGNLFSGASMILTPEPDLPPETLEKLRSFFLSLGFGSIQLSTPDEHDRIIAYTSQLAHVLSSAYVKSPSALRHRGFSAGSFQDMTRVAWLNEEMWTELFLSNRAYLADEVQGLADRLASYAGAIREGDGERLRRLLREGRLRKEEVEGGGHA